jgi:hypothetical protein
MLKLAQTFFEIAIWRKGPQDLPASRFLALLVLFTYLVIAFIAVRLLGLNLRVAVIVTTVALAMLAVWLYLALTLFGRRQRFLQTITAALGAAVLILLLDIAMRSVQLALGLGASASGNWLFARFLIIAIVMSRILMQALDRGLITALALTLAMVHSTEAVAQLMLNTLKGS